MSYFVNTMPNIRLTEPKVPHFPIKPQESINISDTTKIEKLINNTISYLSLLEKYHSSVTKLVTEVNNGLDKLLMA
jgi:hypothetical protein